MKKKLLSVAALASIFLSAFAFSSCADSVSFEKYANADRYTIGNATFASDQVKEIDIDWVGGTIEVEQVAEGVEIVEDKMTGQSDQYMRYYLDDDVLRVKYCASGFSGSIPAQNKNLRVSIPAGVELDIECVTAVVTIGVIETTGFSVENVSGTTTVERVDCNAAKISTVSGKVSVGELKAVGRVAAQTVSGNFSIARLSATTLEAATTSGDLSFGIQTGISAEIDSVSGNVSVILNQNLGAKIHPEIVTGSYFCVKPAEKWKQTGTIIEVFNANGEATNDCQIEVDIFSGNLYIQ